MDQIMFGLQENSMEFSDTVKAMTHDCEVLFGRARDRADRVDGLFMGGGTEAGRNPLHHLIPKIAHAHGFYAFVSYPGEWVYVDHRMGRVLDHGHVNVLPGHKSDSTHFGYNARGITYLTVAPHNKALAPKVTISSTHLITGSYPSSPHYAPFVRQANTRLANRVGSFTKAKSRGSNLSFHVSDTNVDDQHHDVFPGMTTCWDALNIHPPTHGSGGGTIDVIAVADIDGRFAFTDAHSIQDKGLYLATDHNENEAWGKVRPLS